MKKIIRKIIEILFVWFNIRIGLTRKEKELISKYNNGDITIIDLQHELKLSYGELIRWLFMRGYHLDYIAKGNKLYRHINKL